jgi:hypothetical protein
VHAGRHAADRHGGERARHCPPPGCPCGGRRAQVGSRCQQCCQGTR